MPLGLRNTRRAEPAETVCSLALYARDTHR